MTSEVLSGEDAWADDASEAKVEVLVERSGTSVLRSGDEETEAVDVAIDREDFGLLQSVCRLIVLHSMFSNRLPSPRHSA